MGAPKQWQKSALANLAAAHLAVIAENGELPMLDEIIDMPLNALPVLTTSHRDCETRMVDRLKV